MKKLFFALCAVAALFCSCTPEESYDELYADFSISKSVCMVGDEVVFTNKTEGGKAPYTCKWTIGDRIATLTGETVKYTFEAKGTYPIVLVVTDAAGPFNAFTPDAFKPIAQAYVANKDSTGKPIYRDNGFNKELPEWTKAYAGTSKWLVNSAELLNELTGGDKYKSGVVDINPARLEHLFTGYLGGFGDMFLGGYKTISMLWDEDYRNVRNTPVLKAFLNQSDERTSYYQVKKDYASFKDEYEDTVRRLNGYERELKQPETAMEYAERMDFLQRSPQIKRYEVMKTYEKELNKLYQQMREIPDPEVQKAITTTINQIKSDAVTILREIK